MTNSIHDILRQAHDRSLARQQEADRRRDRLHTQDKGATIDQTIANAHDRLHPEQALSEQRWRAAGVPPLDSDSPTRAGRSGDNVLVGGAGDDLLELYQYELAPAYYGAIGALEGANGYGERNDTDRGVERDPRDWAWGHYGITARNLMAMGFLREVPGKKTGEDPETWTGKWGVRSKADFWQNQNQVQERALDEFMRSMHRNNEVLRNFDHVGKVNTRRILELQDARMQPVLGERGQRTYPALTITEAGVQAAAHRAGQGWVREYLKWLGANGWVSRDMPFPEQVDLPDDPATRKPYTRDAIEDWFKKVETRMRLFEKVPYRRAEK